MPVSCGIELKLIRLESYILLGETRRKIVMLYSVQFGKKNVFLREARKRKVFLSEHNRYTCFMVSVS